MEWGLYQVSYDGITFSNMVRGLKQVPAIVGWVESVPTAVLFFLMGYEHNSCRNHSVPRNSMGILTIENYLSAVASQRYRPLRRYPTISSSLSQRNRYWSFKINNDHFLAICHGEWFKIHCVGRVLTSFASAGQRPKRPRYFPNFAPHLRLITIVIAALHQTVQVVHFRRRDINRLLRLRRLSNSCSCSLDS